MINGFADVIKAKILLRNQQWVQKCKNHQFIEGIFSLRKEKIMDIISNSSDGRYHSRIYTFQGRVKTNIYYREHKSVSSFAL